MDAGDDFMPERLWRWFIRAVVVASHLVTLLAGLLIGASL